MSKPRRGFTLVELLAVIVILAVILVIAVPSIMSTITESRKGALVSSAKLIASSAESMKISNQALRIEKDIECKDVSNYTDEDYASCDIKFVDGNAEVTLVGQGKFEGMCVSRATKEDAEAEELISGECPTAFKKDSWSTIKAAVKAGDTSKYRVGDTKTVELGSLGTHTVRIANKSTPTECGQTGFSQTACGFVIEFADIITTHNMNPSGEYNGTTYEYGWNKDGWPGSQMYDYINVTEESGSGVIYNALPEELRNAIIDTKVVSSYGGNDTSYFISTDKLYLLSPGEVYGDTVEYDYRIGYDKEIDGTITRQLDYYKNNNVSAFSYSGAIKQNAGSNEDWWLRSTLYPSYDFFLGVNSAGNWDYHNAKFTFGVSPAFRLG